MSPIRFHRSQWWLLIPLGWILVGIIGPWLVGPMIVLTIFLGGGGMRRCGGRSRAVDTRRQSHGMPAPRPSVDLRKPPAPTQTLSGLAASSRIPYDVRERAQRLDRECVTTLTYLREHGAPTQQVFEVEQIQTDFGPQALRSYLALAPGTEDTQDVLDGKTGHQLIVEQLDLLLAEVAAHLHRAARLGSDELLANHRFLTEKFGPHGDSELTI